MSSSHAAPSSKSVKFYSASLSAGAASDSKFVVDIVNRLEERNRLQVSANSC